MIDRLLAYEAGELTDEQTLDLFRDLVASGGPNNETTSPRDGD